MTRINKDPNRKYYFTTLSEEEIPTLLENIIKFGGELQVWTEGKHKKAEVFYVDKIEEGERWPILKLTKKVSGIFGKLAGSTFLDQDILIKLPLGKFTYFTNSYLTYDEENSLYEANLANTVYKSQQRSNYRLQASSYIKIQFKIADTVFDCGDISAGGVSFVLKDDSEKTFTKGQIYRECEILFNKKRFPIPQAKIAATFDNKDADGNKIDGTKIGIAFIELPEDIEENLTIHINSEARGEEIHKQLQAKKKKA